MSELVFSRRCLTTAAVRMGLGHSPALRLRFGRVLTMRAGGVPRTRVGLVRAGLFRRARVAGTLGCLGLRGHSGSLLRSVHAEASSGSTPRVGSKRDEGRRPPAALLHARVVGTGGV